MRSCPDTCCQTQGDTKGRKTTLWSDTRPWNKSMMGKTPEPGRNEDGFFPLLFQELKVSHNSPPTSAIKKKNLLPVEWEISAHCAYIYIHIHNLQSIFWMLLYQKGSSHLNDSIIRIPIILPEQPTFGCCLRQPHQMPLQSSPLPFSNIYSVLPKW